MAFGLFLHICSMTTSNVCEASFAAYGLCTHIVYFIAPSPANVMLMLVMRCAGCSVDVGQSGPGLRGCVFLL